MQCIYNNNGEQCNAHAMSETEYCYFHNPNISEEEKRLAQSKGGQVHKQKIHSPLEPISITSIQDVTHLLTDTVNQIRAGKMDIKVANSIGYLSGHLLKALEVSDLEKRLEELENLAKQN